MRKTVAIEYRWVEGRNEPAEIVAEFEKDLISQARLTKDPEEVEILRRVGLKTCAVVQASPSTADLKVGRRVKVQCVNGALTRLVAAVEAPAPAPVPTPTTRTAAGNITALTDGAISIHNDENGGFDVTCKLGAASPSLAVSTSKPACSR